MTIYEMTDSELLDAYKKADTYELEMCAELCKRAGMSAEWEAAEMSECQRPLRAQTAQVSVSALPTLSRFLQAPPVSLRCCAWMIPTKRPFWNG